MLESQIQLTRRDWGKFQKAQVASIDNWLDETFGNVIRVVCFKKKYLDYLQDDSWRTIENEIRTAMESRAEVIGYDVEQIFSTPDLNEKDFKDLKPHGFDLTGLPLQSTARAHVDLTVNAIFSISKWSDKGIAERINQGVDLKDDIAVQLRQAMSSILIEVNPNRFFLRFSEVDKNGVSLKDQLQKAAEAKLNATYNANVSSVVVIPVDNDEIRRIRDMLYVPRELEFVVKPLRGPERIKFTVTWEVSDIDPDSWDKVSRPTCNLEAVENSLRRALEATFSGLDPTLLYTRTSEDRARLEEMGFSHPKRHISLSYGLGIELSNLDRVWTEIETEERELWRQTQLAKSQLVRQKIDEQIRLGKLQSDTQIREFERSAEFSEMVFRRFKLLQIKQPNLTSEERDEFAGLKNWLDATSKEVNGPSRPELPSLADLSLASDAIAFGQRNQRAAIEHQSSDIRGQAVGKDDALIKSSGSPVTSESPDKTSTDGQ
jgi:hypothetical protein